MLQRLFALALSGLLLFTGGCSTSQEVQPSPQPVQPTAPAGDEVALVLSDGGVSVDGQAASTDSASPVYVGSDIVYYRDGTDETYGEGTEAEKHSAAEAQAHTVVTITQPGTYRLSGTLSQGQIAVDLGGDAKDDPAAVVTLILDNVDVTCTVAPALIFYNVYECDRAFVQADAEEADYQGTPTVDTAKAGANVVIAKGSVNNFTGSHVARIYKEGTTKKLHKYDGAFYSKMSMNFFGDNGDDSGVLNIVGDNEGLDSELHLTLGGGTVNITSQDDGINTNEDNVSVTTINGGTLTVRAGNGAEGDGIDSNGYLVINGGTVLALGSDHSPDGGIDADRDILLNGGTVCAFGLRNDTVSANSQQAFLELSVAAPLSEGSLLELKDGEGNVVWSQTARGAHRALTVSTPQLAADTDYQLYVDGVLQEQSASGFDHGGMGRPGDFKGERPSDRPEPPEGFDHGDFKGERPSDRPEPPEGFDHGDFKGERPDGVSQATEDFDPGQRPDRGGDREKGGAPAAQDAATQS